MTRVGIVNLGYGNLASLTRAVNNCNKGRVVSVDDPNLIAGCDRLILPGVGALKFAASCMENLNMRDAILGHASAGKPLMGICLGAQLMALNGSEGAKEKVSCLGFFAASVEPLVVKTDYFGKKNLTPHVGYDGVLIDSRSRFSSLLGAVQSFYFIHRYYLHFSAIPLNDSISFCDFYGTKIPAIIEHENLLAVQFHPEKSGKPGNMILNQFLSETIE